MLRRRLAAPLVLAGALLCAPAAAQAVTIGIADQKPDMFGDPRFLSLGIRHARLTVPWDWRSYRWQIDELNRWLFLARLDGVQPLVSFGHSRVRRRSLPTPERFGREVRQFRRRWPFVTQFATWNEANHCGEPTCRRPALVAAYWRKARQACPRCDVLAAEVLDLPGVESWVRAFRRQAKVEPRIWGLHNYVEANRFQTRSLRRLLRQVRGDVWITEVGGIVKRRGTRRTQRNRVKGITESAAHAAKVTRFIFDRVIPLDRRIARVYLYQWNSSTPRDSWDSAFIGSDRRARPAFGVLRRQLAKLRARQRRR